MLEKWSDYDYIIVGVHYNYSVLFPPINVVKVRENLGNHFGEIKMMSRQDVVSKINSGSTFITAIPFYGEMYSKGAKVEIIRVNGVEYLRTDSNTKAEDNLGNLPKF